MILIIGPMDGLEKLARLECNISYPHFDPQPLFLFFFRQMEQHKLYNDWKILVIASLTLGLAPFFPEPHIVGKIRWIAGGAHGMDALDWFDFFWHGLPWMLLLRKIFISLKEKLQDTRQN